MRRLFCLCALALLVAWPASAQRARVDNNVDHVICDSGCSSTGGVTDIDDDAVAPGQTLLPTIGLNYWYNSDIASWTRTSDIAPMPVRANVNGTVSVAFSSTATGNATLGSLNAAATMDITGLQTAGFYIQAGTLAGTVSFEGSTDSFAWEPVTVARHDQTIPLRHVTAVVLTNPNEAVYGTFMVAAPFKYVRLIVSAYTSGSAVGMIQGTSIQSPFADNLAAAVDAGFAPKAVIIGGGLSGTTAHAFQSLNAAPGVADYGLVVRNVPSGTQAVSGTFWQATQPVSGTFWQATQPVSGTFWQATQPVSGTFWQATQPVSGTVTVTGVSTLSEQQAQTTSLQLIDDVVVAEDVASADADKGVRAMAIRKATPANTSGTDGDNEQLQMSAGRLWTSTTVDAALPAGNNNIGDVDVVTLPANASVNVNQIGGNAVSTGTGAAGATGTQRVVTATDSTIGTVTTVTTVTSVTQNADVRQATAANLNVRPDTSGATAAAVPARADYIGLNDGTNVIGAKAHSAATDATAIVTGAIIASPIATWCVNHTPAAATKATISQGAGAAGVRHVITTYSACFAAGATAGPVQTFTVRDGATGAGTVLWSGALAAPANDSTCTTGALDKVGTAATAATIEFGAAGAATTIETVSMCGYDVQ